MNFNDLLLRLDTRIASNTVWHFESLFSTISYGPHEASTDGFCLSVRPFTDNKILWSVEVHGPSSNLGGPASESVQEMGATIWSVVHMDVWKDGQMAVFVRGGLVRMNRADFRASGYLTRRNHAA